MQCLFVKTTSNFGSPKHKKIFTLAHLEWAQAQRKWLCLLRTETSSDCESFNEMPKFFLCSALYISNHYTHLCQLTPVILRCSTRCFVIAFHKISSLLLPLSQPLKTCCWYQIKNGCVISKINKVSHFQRLMSFCQFQLIWGFIVLQINTFCNYTQYILNNVPAFLISGLYYKELYKQIHNLFLKNMGEMIWILGVHIKMQIMRRCVSEVSFTLAWIFSYTLTWHRKRNWWYFHLKLRS